MLEERHNKHPLEEDFEDFFNRSHCGFLTTNPAGEILNANSCMIAWTGYEKEEILGKRFSDFLTIGGKIFYETHFWPLLRMQGFFDEVALELSCKNGEKLQVLVNAFERRDEGKNPLFVRLSLFKATQRRTYEQNLQAVAKIAEKNLSDEQEMAALREQFIAVLGHDLRNPLSAIISGSAVLSKSSLNDTQSLVVGIVQKSASRMRELIDNVMDFARSRLGAGMVVIFTDTLLQPFLSQVVDELRAVWPDRQILVEWNITESIACDGPRIAQLFSNLLANALIHGDARTPVQVNAICYNDFFELSIINTGKPIPDEVKKRLFLPFTREQGRASQNGLGLGLYIASEIANAHHGTLTVSSNSEETRFIFQMPRTQSTR